MNDLQEKLLQHFKSVTKVLENNNIPYVAIGGTAIGAIRESGFIPWDDDMDIGIKLEDYERFISVIKKHSKFKSSFLKGAQRLPWFKVLDGDTKIIEGGEKVDIFLDVFLYTEKIINYKKMDRKIKFKQTIIDCKVLSFKRIKGTEGFVPAVFSKLYGLFLWFLPSNFLHKKIIREIKIAKKYNSKKMYVNGNVDDERADFKEITKYQFEDTFVPIGSTFREDNMHYFGDIMVPPKKSDRLNHGIILVEKDDNE